MAVETEAGSLIVFVRGIRGIDGGVGLRDEFKVQLNRFLAARGDNAASNVSISGYTGLRAEFGSAANRRRVDILEVDWEPSLNKLSGAPLIRRVLLGILLLWQGFRAALRTAESPGFAYLSFATLVIIFAWLVLVLAVGLAAAEKSVPPAYVPAWIGAVDKSVFFNVLKIVALLIVAVMAIVNVSTDVTVDLADMILRYLSNNSMVSSTITLREMLVQKVYDATIAARASATYEHVVLLGHSLGALIGVEAATRLDGVAAITVGSFFNYLSILNPATMAEIKQKAGKIPHWLDIYSEQDWIANSKACLPDSAHYRGVAVDLGSVSWFDKLSTRTHTYYFRCDEVFQAMLGRP